MKSFVIKNAFCPLRQSPVSVLVRGGVIEEIGEQVDGGEGLPHWEAEGALLLPSAYDMHVHVGEPGNSARETLASAVDAAINGGVTGFAAIPDKASVLDKPSLLSALEQKAESLPLTVQFAANITEGGQGEQQASYGFLASRGITLLSDGAVPVQNPLLLRRAMQYAGELNLIFALKGDVASLTENAMAHESSTAYALGLNTAPSCAEEMGVFMALSLGKDTGARVHIQTVSCAESLEVFRKAKAEGRFSAEVGLAHLLFSHEDIGDLDTVMKTEPPLRSASDKEALLEGLRSGVIDCLVSDHTPATTFEKMQDFCSAPFGMTGLDTFMPVIYSQLIQTGKLTWPVVLKAINENPRRLMGLEPARLEVGAKADFILLDTQKQSVVDADFVCSKAKNTPWWGKTLESRVTWVCSSRMLKNELMPA